MEPVLFNSGHRKHTLKMERCFNGESVQLQYIKVHSHPRENVLYDAFNFQTKGKELIAIRNMESVILPFMSNCMHKKGL